MPGKIFVRIHDQRKVVLSGTFDGPIELGRRREGINEALYSANQMEDGSYRLTAADAREDGVSRRHAGVELQSDGRLLIRNLSATAPIPFEDGSNLAPGESLVALGFAAFRLAAKLVRLEAVQEKEDPFFTLAARTIAPGVRMEPPAEVPLLNATGEAAELAEAVVSRLRGVLEIFEIEPDAGDYLDRAARAATQVVSLDLCAAFTIASDGWDRQCLIDPYEVAGPNWQPNVRLLQRLLDEKRTFLKQIGEEADLNVLASPILDGRGQVIGALYGERGGERFKSGNKETSDFSKLEAMLFELTAMGAAAGLARQVIERKALQSQLLLEQFFASPIAKAVAEDPELLNDRIADITILAAAVRDFSADSLAELMDELAASVRDREGVLLDVGGSLLTAMWGAPVDQLDHPMLACAAALEMSERFAKVASVVSPTARLGIGIDSGKANTGNQGSRRRFKYAASGVVVQVAEQLRDMGFGLGATVLATGVTRDRLRDPMDGRRLGLARLNVLVEPIAIHQIVSADAPPDEWDWPRRREAYERAEERFQLKDFHGAALILGEWLESHPDDGPARAMLLRSLRHLTDPLSHSAFDPFWRPEMFAG